MSIEDILNGALRKLVVDLMADRPAAALPTFEAWCFDHSEDIQLMVLIQELKA